MLRSAAEAPPPLPLASTSSSAAAAAERGDIPDCVLSELWAEHSSGVGSPLIDIYTETDCSSQVSDDEPAGGDLAVLPIAISEKLIEVVEDDDFGAVSEGGGLIWVVENDVGGADSSEESRSPRPQSLVDLNGAVNISPQRSSAYSEGDSTVWNNRLQKPLTPKRRKPSGKRRDDHESAARSRASKSPRKSLTLSPGSGGVDAAGADAVPAEPTGTLPRMDGTLPAPLCRISPAGDGPPLQPAAAAGSETVGPAADAAEFVGFPERSWIPARARWLRELSGVAAEEREAGDVSAVDAALLRLRELATAAAASRLPPAIARPAAPRGQGDGDPPAPAICPPSSAAAAVSGGPTEQAGGACGDAASIAPPTYVSLMPDAEKDSFKSSFMSMFSLRHVNDPAPPASRPNRTMRQRLRKRKPAAEDAAEKAEPARPTGPRSLLVAARRPSALPSSRRVKVLRKPDAGLLRRGFVEQRGAGAGDSSGDEAAAAAERRQLRGRRRLLDFSELVEVEGVLDMADTYSGCEEPPRLLPESTPAEDGPRHSPPPGPPELWPQRWPRVDAARCRVCRKFIARALLPLHLRLHRTGYRGCDVCGLVLESAAALYQHRLGHEPPRFPCHRCGRQFDAAAKLERHRASAHALLCARCGAPVRTPELVHDHDCDGRLEPPPPPRPASLPPPAASPPQEELQEQQQEQQQQQQQPEEAVTTAATTAAPAAVPAAVPAAAPAAAPPAAAPSDVKALTSSADKKRHCGAAGDGLICHACGKSFLVRFNYMMHMKMVHKRSPSRPAGERGATSSALVPDVISCLGDILSADLYSEILSVV